MTLKKKFSATLLTPAANRVRVGRIYLNLYILLSNSQRKPLCDEAL